MSGLGAFLERLIVCAIVYALLEALFPNDGRRRGLLESAARAAAIVLTAAVINA